MKGAAKMFNFSKIERAVFRPLTESERMEKVEEYIQMKKTQKILRKNNQKFAHRSGEEKKG